MQVRREASGIGLAEGRLLPWPSGSSPPWWERTRPPRPALPHSSALCGWAACGGNHQNTLGPLVYWAFRANIVHWVSYSVFSTVSMPTQRKKEKIVVSWCQIAIKPKIHWNKRKQKYGLIYNKSKNRDMSLCALEKVLLNVYSGSRI